MSAESSENRDTATIADANAHGHAAILLVESLIHGLIARDVLTVTDAVEIVDTATEVSVDIAGDRGSAAADVRTSVGLLEAISSSLSRDLPR